jgi:hypothetical protein
LKSLWLQAVVGVVATVVVPALAVLSIIQGLLLLLVQQ